MIRRFINDTSGNFAIVFAVLALPLLSSLLLGYDHFRFNQLENKLKVAVEASLMATAQEMQAGRIKSKAADAFMKNFLLANLSQASDANTTVKVKPLRRRDGHISEMEAEVSVIFQPLSGRLATMVPAKSAKGEVWIAQY